VIVKKNIGIEEHAQQRHMIALAATPYTQLNNKKNN